MANSSSSQKLQSAVWKSVESNPVYNPDFQETSNEQLREFPEAVQELIDRGASANLDRKKFLTLMGASLSMAGLNCFKEPVEKIVPYTKRPVETTPGVAKYYATAWANSGEVIPMLVKTREGKPIKVEGHAAHPIAREAMTANGHAAIWDLYDPDRLRAPLSNGQATTWDAALKQAATAIKGAKNLRVLSRPSFSPSEQAAVKGFLKKGSGRKQITYDALGNLQEVIEGDAASFGTAIVPDYRFDKADLILSIGADFLGTWLSPGTFTKRYGKTRKLNKGMGRLIVAESNLSLTGSNADTRIPLTSGTLTTFGLAVANVLAKGGKYASALSGYTPEKVASATGVSAQQIRAVAKELAAKKGKSLVVAGSTREGKAGGLQVVANLINSILGNEGKTVQTAAAMKDAGGISSSSAVEKLIADMRAGKVDVLILEGSNPLHDLPAHLRVGEALARVKTIIAIADHVNDSTDKAHVVLAASHFMEAWGDAYSYGVYSVSQPVIRPLFDTRSTGDIWLALAGSKSSFHKTVKTTAGKYGSGSFNSLLSKGFRVVKKAGGSGRKFRAGALKGIKGITKPLAGYRLSLYETVQVGGGDGGNNAYRHELPDPVSKVCWGNYLAVSPADAKANGWEMGDVVAIKATGVEVKAPVFIQPGLPAKSVALAVGYGHGKIGKVGAGVGVNAFALAKLTKGNYRTSGLSVTLQATGDCETVATTQRNHDMVGRNLSRSTTLKTYQKNPKEAGHEGEHSLPGKGLYPPHKYEGYRWGMNIDLNKCTGCSACVVSCYSENNIPVVGKEEIAIGREMSWMRIDRYYKGGLDNPEVLFQPVLCQHCENAPCENVCPVAATSHSSEGLNDMAYNRCIGTRYCANNCPFKVRRFNWFENWEGKLRDPEHLALNPDVTVRSRGVIEKCSFCVQRINGARQEAKLNNRSIRDADLKTACQQGCPADAIEFGDVNNKNTKVAKAENDPRSYKILEHINVKPMVSYRVKVNNVG